MKVIKNIFVYFTPLLFLGTLINGYYSFLLFSNVNQVNLSNVYLIPQVLLYLFLFVLFEFLIMKTFIKSIFQVKVDNKKFWKCFGLYFPVYMIVQIALLYLSYSFKSFSIIWAVLNIPVVLTFVYIKTIIFFYIISDLEFKKVVEFSEIAFKKIFTRLYYFIVNGAILVAFIVLLSLLINLVILPSNISFIQDNLLIFLSISSGLTTAIIKIGTGIILYSYLTEFVLNYQIFKLIKNEK